MPRSRSRSPRRRIRSRSPPRRHQSLSSSPPLSTNRTRPQHRRETPPVPRPSASSSPPSYRHGPSSPPRRDFALSRSHLPQPRRPSPSDEMQRSRSISVSPDRVKLSKIKIVLLNQDRRPQTSPMNVSVAETLERALRISEEGGDFFWGPEEDPPSEKEVKKIQIEIRRSIPQDRIRRSPVRRSIRDPSTVVVSRKPDEGTKPLLDRYEIKNWLPDVPEERVIAVINEVPPVATKNTRSSRSPERRKRLASPKLNHHPSLPTSDGEHPSSRRKKTSLSPLSKHLLENGFSPPRNLDRMHSRVRRSYSEDTRCDESGWSGGGKGVRDRLGPQTVLPNEFRRDQVDPSTGVRSRLGPRLDHRDEMDEILNREDLQRRRPFDTSQWDANPEFVPKGNSYFEHDNRDVFTHHGGRRGGGYRGGGGGYRGGSFFNRGGDFYRSRGGRGGYRQHHYERGKDYRNGGRNYYQHNYFGHRNRYENSDRLENRYDREDYRHHRRDAGGDYNRGRGRWRGRAYYYHQRRSYGRYSPDWQHDKYDESQKEEPTSTTT